MERWVITLNAISHILALIEMPVPDLGGTFFPRPTPPLISFFGLTRTDLVAPNLVGAFGARNP
jgi:hypothetical protein